MSKILYIDIETSPNVVYSWRVGYNIELSPETIVEERRIICVSYKFSDEDEVHTLTWDKKLNDKGLLKKLKKVLDKADVVVAHNGDRFDIRWIKTRNLMHGLAPITDIQTIDTLKLVKSNFNFNSNKLDYLVKAFNLGAKTETGGYSLWKRCMAGDSDALDKMVYYCENDVLILEKLFNHLKAYVDKMPVHYGILEGNGRDSCPSCGSEDLNKYGTRAKRVGLYQRLRCKTCAYTFTDSRMIKDAK